jgi:hypothetical protein
MRASVLRITLGTIGVVQLILGVVFLFLPEQFASVLGLTVTPTWVPWMFAMFGARALGFAYGMFLAMRNPESHRDWIGAMIAVQALDWIATVWFVLQGAVTIPQVSGAAFLPIIFILVLVTRFPQQQTKITA